MKRLVAIGNIVAAIAVVIFLYLAVTESSALAQLSLDADQATALVLIFPVYILTIALGAIAWTRLLRSTGTDCRYLLGVQILFLSQAAKYIPGNVAHHVGRVALAKKHGLPISSTLFSMFLETLWAISIASLVSVSALVTGGAAVFSGLPELPAWQILAGLGVATLILPLIGQRVFVWAAGLWAARQQVSPYTLKMPGLRTFWEVGLLYIGNYLMLGVILYLIAGQVFGTTDNDLLLLAGIFTVAWTVGFITPGAPAGLGVRELLLVGMLTPVYTAEIAVAIAATLRLVTVVGDGLTFLCGVAIGRIDRGHNAGPTAAGED